MSDPNGPQSAWEQYRRRRLKRGGLDPEQGWVGTKRTGLPSTWGEIDPARTRVEWAADPFLDFLGRLKP